MRRNSKIELRFLIFIPGSRQPVRTWSVSGSSAAALPGELHLLQHAVYHSSAPQKGYPLYFAGIGTAMAGVGATIAMHGLGCKRCRGGTFRLWM